MKKILGIPITLFVIGVLVVGSGLALLVSYLSNTITRNVDITSPIEVTGSIPLSLSVYGGENIIYDVEVINRANLSIDTYPIIQVTGPGIWQGTEFIDVLMSDNETTYNLTSKLYVIKDDGTLLPFVDVGSLSKTTIKLYWDDTSTGLHTYNRGIGFDMLFIYNIKTNVAIMPGTYTFKNCELYDVLGDCE